MNRRCIIISIFLILVFFLMVPVSLSSTETGNQGDLVWSGTVLSIRNVSVHDLIRFVETATVYAEREGKDAALHEFALQNGSFTRGDLYIWAYDFEGVNLAHPWHPEFSGKNKLDLTDPTGFHMITAMRDMAFNGSGFVWYQYENPVSGAVEPKLAYVKRVDDTWWLASGIYGPNVSVPQDTPDSIRDFLIGHVQKALDYVQEHGEEDAVALFNDPSGPFVTNDTYVFAFDNTGTTLAMPFYPDTIGKNERDKVDVNGVLIGEEKLMVAADGGGFFYYVFENPHAQNASQFKVSFIHPVSDSLIVGAGMNLPDVHASFSEKRRVALISKVQKAAAFVQEHGKEAAIMEFNDPNGSFSDREMFVFAFDSNGTLLANPFLPGLVGQSRLQDRDPYGKYPVKQLIWNAKQGGGFTYYFFADPAFEYAVRLKLGYTEMAEDDLIVGAGIFPES